MKKAKTYNKHKFALTAQRRIILEELRKVTSHPTADEIFAMVRKCLPRISLGTVYRNLEKMSAEGLIQKIETSDTKRRFDANIENHYHIRCTSCGKVDDMFGIRFMDLESISRQLHGYKIDGYRLELTGVCPRCLRAIKKKCQKVVK